MDIRSGVLAFVFLTLPLSAHAYLDPGTGSVLLQVILGGAAAVGVALKLYWGRIRAAFRRNDRPEAE